MILLTGGGACVVLFRGGSCVVLSGGGGVCGFSSFFGYNEIRSMSGQYASYWNAFLFMSMDFETLCKNILKQHNK